MFLCLVRFHAQPAKPQAAHTTAFLKPAAPGCYMLCALVERPSFLASLTWKQYLRHTLLCVASYLGTVYLLTGLYLKVEIKHGPHPPFCIYECLLWLLGAEAAEL